MGMRYAMDEGEVYAVVTRIFGGAQCEVRCADGKTRRCIIRAKFRGRRRRENQLESGTWVLAGVRDWGNSDDTKQICDLLTVYTAAEKDTLRRSGCANLAALVGGDKEGEEQNAEIVFDSRGPMPPPTDIDADVDLGAATEPVAPAESGRAASPEISLDEI